LEGLKFRLSLNLSPIRGILSQNTLTLNKIKELIK
jgi:hypothetical protein